MYDHKMWFILKRKADKLAISFLENKDLSDLSPTEFANLYLEVEDEIGKVLVSHYAAKEWSGKGWQGKKCEGKEWPEKECPTEE
jgi:hypothetical protein